MIKERIGICKICKKEFLQKYPNEKYCSDECRAIGYHENSVIAQRVCYRRRKIEKVKIVHCKFCGTAFTQKDKKMKCCSNLCESKLFLNRYRKQTLNNKHIKIKRAIDEETVVIIPKQINYEETINGSDSSKQ